MCVNYILERLINHFEPKKNCSSHARDKFREFEVVWAWACECVIDVFFRLVVFIYAIFTNKFMVKWNAKHSKNSLEKHFHSIFDVLLLLLVVGGCLIFFAFVRVEVHCWLSLYTILPVYFSWCSKCLLLLLLLFARLFAYLISSFYCVAFFMLSSRSQSSLQFCAESFIWSEKIFSMCCVRLFLLFVDLQVFFDTSCS